MPADDISTSGATMRRAPNLAATSASVVLDGRDFSGEDLLVEAMNIRHIGPGLALAPDADPTDGRFDLILTTESDRKILEDYFSHRRGRLSKNRLAVHRGKRLRIKCDDVHAHVDDAVWPDQESGPKGQQTSTVSVDGHQVKFLAPARKNARAMK
jgi:diacylglycerol kinase family enzyme